ncbi:alpha/beta hydrolase [Seohaeicola saemankumensis]|nr:alpha/beta hydrolase [Seohaeicola saemankumensis]MCA0872058.1 alpha/beta hydrolase [Seohaeicola saemankumensis]
MPVVRINSVENRPQLHGTSRPAWPILRRLGPGPGPVIVMIHGYKYEPGHARHCPHRHILSLHPASLPDAWPRPLGFGAGHRDEGLGIAFGWNARGALWSAQARARDAGRVLARVIGELHRLAPARPVHIVAHSMGTEVALEALHHLPAGAVDRILSLTGACYRSRTATALATPAGQSAEFVNITSRENDPFDFLFERLITPPRPGDRSIGQGLDGPGTVTLQLDCPGTLDHLDRIGLPVAPPQRRICHWSSYTRPGVLQMYSALLRRPGAFPLDALRRGLPPTPAPRWSRLITLPSGPGGLRLAQKPG